MTATGCVSAMEPRRRVPRATFCLGGSGKVNHVGLRYRTAPAAVGEQHCRRPQLGH